MATGFNITTWENALKAYYTKDYVKNMTYSKRPLFAMLKKFEMMGGGAAASKGFIQPVLFGNPQARSATFSQSQARSTAVASNIAAFNVTRVKNYSIVTVDGETLRASAIGSEGAFFEAVKTAVDGAMRAITIDAATNLYRTGFGSIGQVSSPGASTTLTLVDSDDVVNFEKDQQLVFSASDGADLLRDSADFLTVVGVNRSAGTLTMDANVTNIAAIANNDFIFIRGDRQDSATPTRLKIAGLGDWVPSTAPTSTAFFGVDRTSDTRLGGTRFDGTGGQPIEETLIDMAMLVTREGGQPDYAFINPSRFGRLVKSLDTRKRYVDVMVGGIGFSALEVDTPAGTIRVISDPFCPMKRVFMLQMDTWILGSLGQLPGFLHHSGQDKLFLPSDDGVEMRIGYYGNLIGKAPGWNSNGQIS